MNAATLNGKIASAPVTGSLTTMRAELWVASDGNRATIPVDNLDADGCMLVTAQQMRLLLHLAGFRHQPGLVVIPDEHSRTDLQSG